VRKITKIGLLRKLAHLKKTAGLWHVPRSGISSEGVHFIPKKDLKKYRELVSRYGADFIDYVKSLPPQSLVRWGGEAKKVYPQKKVDWGKAKINWEHLEDKFLKMKAGLGESIRPPQQTWTPPSASSKTVTLDEMKRYMGDRWEKLRGYHPADVEELNYFANTYHKAREKFGSYIPNRILLTKEGHMMANQAPASIVSTTEEYLQKVAATPDSAIQACLAAHKSGNTKLAEAIYDVFKDVHGYKLPVSVYFDLNKEAIGHKKQASIIMNDVRLIASKRMYPIMTKEAANESMSVIASRWRTMPVADRVEASKNLRKYASLLHGRVSSDKIPAPLAKYAGLINTPGDESRYKVALTPRSKYSIRKFGFDKYASLPKPTYSNAHDLILKIAAIDQETGANWYVKRNVFADPADVVFCGPPVSEVYGVTKVATAPVITAHGIKIDLSKLSNVDKREVDRVVPGLGDEIFDADGDLDFAAANTVIPSLPMDLVTALKKRFNL